MSTRMYVAHYQRQQLIVEATSTFHAQQIAAEKLHLRPSLAHYIAVRAMTHNIHRDRYTETRV